MDYYKGKMSYNEAINLPNRIFHTLYTLLQKKLSTDEGKNELTSKKVVEAIEGVVT